MSTLRTGQTLLAHSRKTASGNRPRIITAAGPLHVLCVAEARSSVRRDACQTTSAVNVVSSWGCSVFDLISMLDVEKGSRSENVLSFHPVSGC